MTKIEYQKQVLKEIFKLDTPSQEAATNKPKYIPSIRFEDAHKYTDYRSNANYPGYEGL